jgi:hypothetical protein
MLHTYIHIQIQSVCITPKLILVQLISYILKLLLKLKYYKQTHILRYNTIQNTIIILFFYGVCFKEK